VRIDSLSGKKGMMRLRLLMKRETFPFLMISLMEKILKEEIDYKMYIV